MHRAICLLVRVLTRRDGVIVWVLLPFSVVIGLSASIRTVCEMVKVLNTIKLAQCFAQALQV